MLLGHHPDLVLLDIFLQREDGGFSIAGTLQQRAIPFVYVTAHPNTLQSRLDKLGIDKDAFR